MGSLSNLKKQLAEARALKQQQQQQQHGEEEKLAGGLAAAAPASAQDGGSAASTKDAYDPNLPIEMQRILTDEDFERIRCVWAGVAGWPAGWLAGR